MFVDKLKQTYNDPGGYILDLKNTRTVRIPALLRKFHTDFVTLLVGDANNEGLGLSRAETSTLAIDIVAQLKDAIKNILKDLVPANIMDSALKSSTI